MKIRINCLCLKILSTRILEEMLLLFVLQISWCYSKTSENFDQLCVFKGLKTIHCPQIKSYSYLLLWNIIDYSEKCKIFLNWQQFPFLNCNKHGSPPQEMWGRQPLTFEKFSLKRRQKRKKAENRVLIWKVCQITLDNFHH
jgi:hypothetical protein